MIFANIPATQHGHARFQDLFSWSCSWEPSFFEDFFECFTTCYYLKWVRWDSELLMTFPNALEWLGAGRLARPHHHLCFHHLHYPVHSNHQLQSLGKLPNQMSRKESSPFYSFCLTQETQQKTGKAFFSGAPGAVDSLESVKFSRGAGCTSLTCLLLFQTVRKQINVTPVCYVFLWNIIDDRIFRNF